MNFDQVDLFCESVFNPKKSSVYKVTRMRKPLKMFPYELQLLQSLTDGDKIKTFSIFW